MLPRGHRLTSPDDFATAIRRGRRAGGRLMVLHTADGPAQVKVGFVVSKAVGNAVVRNRVQRRLRHLVASRLGELAPGLLVVRAQPAAAGATYGELGSDLDRCLRRAGVFEAAPDAEVSQ